MKQSSSSEIIPSQEVTHQKNISHRIRALIVRCLLGIFFFAQTWVALSYYWGDHPWDERFAWRMFSTVRNLKCDYQIWRGVKDGVDMCPDETSTQCERVWLSREQHMVWVNLMRRGRLSVLDQLAYEDCQRQGIGGRYFVKMTCQAAQAPHQPMLIQSERVNLCAHPQTRTLSDFHSKSTHFPDFLRSSQTASSQLAIWSE